MDFDFQNLEKQCRFCLKLISIDDYYEEVFSEGLITGILKEKMTKCFDMKKMNFEERLPNKICSSCVKKLDEFYIFSSEFEINQEKLEQSSIKTGLLIENINSEQERDHSTAANGMQSGHKQLVLKQHVFITEKLKVLAIKEENDEKVASNTFTEVIERVHNSSDVLKKEKKEEEIENMKNEKVASHLEKTVPVVNDRLGEPKNVDYKPTQRAKGSIYTCQICSSTFNNEYEVQSHLKIHSNYINHIKRELRDCIGISTVNSEFSHSQSGGFTSNGALNDFQYQCYLCPSVFNSQDLLYTHIKQHEIENSITNKNEIECLSSNISTKIICKICKKGFFTTSRYDLHVIEDHDPEKEVSPRRRGRIFQCNDCNKIFKSKVDITRHVSIHLKRKSAHVCSVCGKEYVFPVALKNHMLKHDPNYKIECPMCLERFSKRKDLKTHKCRSVPPITVFKCNTCSLEFSSLNFLRIHEDLDHGIGAPYTCDYCTRTFTSNEGLMAHVNENHFEVNGCPEMSMKIENTDDIKKKETNDLLFDEELATNLEILMCTLCGALCITNEEFQEHMAGHIII